METKFHMTLLQEEMDKRTREKKVHLGKLM